MDSAGSEVIEDLLRSSLLSPSPLLAKLPTDPLRFVVSAEASSVLPFLFSSLKLDTFEGALA